MKRLMLAFVVIPVLLLAQTKKQKKALEAQRKADQVIVNNLKSHTQNLSSIIGSNKEKSAEYIITQFKLIGLQPKGTAGYFQQFKFQDGKEVDNKTFLKVNNSNLELGKDYLPLPYSAEKSISGMPAMALREKGVPWFIDVKEWVDGTAKDKKVDIDEAVKKEAVKVAAKGATALFVFNSSGNSDIPTFNKEDKSAALSIPVIYILPEGYKKHFSDNSALLDIELHIAFRERTYTASNIAGYIDNKAPATIVVASPYDLWDLGNTGSGASDPNPAAATNVEKNICGVSILMELAKMLSASKVKTNNYLFIASAGDTLGKTGLGYWLQTPTTPSPTNYLVNLFMVGASKDGIKLNTSGLVSSPSFSDLIAASLAKYPDIKISSDNTSDVFETASSIGVPYLYFTDKGADAQKLTGLSEINYEDELKITKFIDEFLEASGTKGKLAFAKKL